MFVRFVCQVVDGDMGLPCKRRESGGYRCEKQGSHRAHRIGSHTAWHATYGNGYTCEAIENMIKEDSKKSASTTRNRTAG